jgi:alpha-amylase/alpha-mannosidase (GH57 family)
MEDKTKRYLCIHGHFYQPPRENPWLEAVETEKSAAPYHDWNERITDECYAANLAARILNNSNEIISIVNNYARLSHNFGPTFLAWLETNQPEAHNALIDSDKENAASYSGHGPAMAQAYNHIIMPLASRRDKETQVIWGIADFRRRYGREPEGMWLPETAVDLETLDVMAGQGIKFTILGPHQAGRVRAPGGRWHDGGEEIDTSRPYRCPLPSGRQIAIFFYHAGLSRGVAFEGLLESGDALAERISAAYNAGGSPHLVTIATDGETYGHHHHFGEMALAYAFDKLERSGIRVTTPAEFLSREPPELEVEIIENTAWSCGHGIERWRSGCCCSTGLHPDWNQDWRGPLRRAMDLLRDRLAPVFEREAGLLLTDPWAARNDYVSVIADRSPENISAFFERWALRQLSEAEQVRALKLLELQRHLMSIYTSCGWFFDDVAGLESVLVMKQAGRALHLARELFGETPEKEFLDILSTAVSNDPMAGTGKEIFEREVPPLDADLKKAAAHFAVSSFFQEYAAETVLYTFKIAVASRNAFGTGRLRMAAGDITVNSLVTLEQAHLVYGALLWGDHNLHAGVALYKSAADYIKLLTDLKVLSDRADCAGCLKFLESRFHGSIYDLGGLVGDEQTKIIDRIIAGTLAETEAAHRGIYRRHHHTMRFLATMGHALPPHFMASAAFVINTDLQRDLEAENPDLKTIEALLAEARLLGVAPDAGPIAYYLADQMEKLMIRFGENPDDMEALAMATGLLRLFKDHSILANLWRVQNLYFAMLEGVYNRRSKQARYDAWQEQFQELGRMLSMKVD